jgi:hypothetical protein
VKQNHNKHEVEPVRSTRPMDEVRNQVNWHPGDVPRGGYRSVYSFGSGFATTKPEPNRKVCSKG